MSKSDTDSGAGLLMHEKIDLQTMTTSQNQWPNWQQVCMKDHIYEFMHILGEQVKPASEESRITTIFMLISITSSGQAVCPLAVL